jgi:decaprenyl-phosphate phosphoribosyltransferase
MLTSTSPVSLFFGLVKTMRPHQWTKNVLVFAAPVAGGVIFQSEITIKTVAAFIIFCSASASTYLLNDARDVEMDRLHPKKKYRPVASGQVPVSAAYFAGVALLIISVASALLVESALAATVAAYLLLTSAYSAVLKNVAVVDLVAVAAGFVLRAVAGSAATSVPLSEWFLITTSAAALLLIVAKREGELHRMQATNAPSARKVLEEYTPSFLHSVRSVATGLVLVAYCLWAFGDAATVDPLWAKISLLPFIVVVLRYSLLADKGEAERPERLVFTDPVLILSGAAWAALYCYGVYAV